MGSPSEGPRVAAGLVARLSSSLGRRDDGPNRELACELAAARDKAGVRELVALCAASEKAVRRDAASAFSELAGRAPALARPHLDAAAKLVERGEGPTVWCAMQVFSAVAAEDPAAVAPYLALITAAAAGDSVIARDHAVRVLARLSRESDTEAAAAQALLGILKTCPIMQLATYVETALSAVLPKRRAAFMAVAHARLPELTRPTQVKRVLRALKSAASA